MAYSGGFLDILEYRLANGLTMPLLSSCIAVSAILILSAAVRFVFLQSTQIPIALSDQITSRKKRAEKYSFDSRNVLTQAYSKFKHQIFGIDTSEGTIVVLPAHFIDELKSNPALTFAATFDTLTLPDYTRIKPAPQEVLKLFLGKFNPSLGSFMPYMQRMFRDELLAAIPPSDDWKPVKIYQIIFRLVCKSAAMSLLGEAAAENDKWLQVEADYINTAIPYVQNLKKWPRALRPLVYRHVEGYETLKRQWSEGRAIIAEYLSKKKASNWKPLQDPPSLFDHVTAKYRDISIDDHLSLQITFFVAGVHTSAATATQAIFDAAVNGSCIDEIKEEVQAIHTSCGGVITRQHLGQLPKLDSFVKEVLRFSSPDLATFVRKSSKDIVLSSGFRIPSGTTLEVATGAIGMDREIYDDPAVFDGLRFWRMRQTESEAVKHQFTSVSPGDLDWGYGRHACPGRYMAEVTIKLLLVQILLHFEIKNPAGMNRHKNIEFDGQTMPNTEAEVLMKGIRT
ncbi:hypothetical protein BHE90_014368 [Fusarium euwallaceae]|uniref:Cytochrome P450 monooxygenase ATR2 n=1 Tax=Fusarium euwallaceae TaxID=1147111 RepID=A0A430L661_9HYPO|nr:hypothetical protein BHE90_014368 [Fusarium euwallaceae]